MADKRFPSLPGFRDFAPKECAIRNYLYEMWREVANRYGFTEYEAPILESTSLYQKKAGDELNSQLFRFEDQGGRDVTLRPELTASLGRMVCANQRDFPKPMKWFEIGPCFRYEAPQKGRGREFIQFNVDIIGETSTGADAELISLAIDAMWELGFREDDFEIRASDRQIWVSFCEKHKVDDITSFLQIIDKWEKNNEAELTKKLEAYNLTYDVVADFLLDNSHTSDAFTELVSNLEARGLEKFLVQDKTIVRGLAYYTGIVFEIFDKKRSMRAVAGGGRYDNLLKTLSNDAIDLPCTGFAMGDMVIANFIEETPNAKIQLESWLMDNARSDVYLVIACEEQRATALKLATQLRDLSLRVNFPLSPLKVNKQFKKAEEAHAHYALVLGEEFPEVKLKNLASKTEETAELNEDFLESLLEKLMELDGPLIT